jgi:predicted alpha/beta hydrolase family esterase
MPHPADAPRLLIVPGLNDSGPAHWQTWLQAFDRRAVRVSQRDWATPDLERWAARIASVLEHAGPGPWIAAAHSFGCLALVRHLARRPDSGVAAALLVAPADPHRFGVAGLLPAHALRVPSVVVGSETDPWMSASEARAWSRRWGSHFVNLGDAGHINVASGFGPLPLARRWTIAMGQRLQRARSAQQAQHGASWSCAA